MEGDGLELIIIITIKTQTIIVTETESLTIIVITIIIPIISIISIISIQTIGPRHLIHEAKQKVVDEDGLELIIFITIKVQTIILVKLVTIII